MSAKRICIEKDQQIFDVDDKDSKVVINSLDYDSLAKIFMLLPIPERIDMEKVCTKWKEACQLAWYDIKEYKCQSSIGRCYDNRLLTQPYLEKILLGCGKYLKELSLSDVCDSSIMSFVGDHCKNLTSLECKFDDNFLINNADHFIQAFTQLDKLKCIKIILESRKNKETVNILEIINSLPKKINEIHLLSNLLSFQKRRVFMSFKNFINLQKLTVQGFLLENIILQEISEITTLVHLNFRPYDEDHEYPLFDKLVNLECIDLMTQYIWLNMKNLSTKVLKTIFCTCKNLKHLDIPFGHYDVAEIPLKKWINFQNLEYLGISCNIMPDLANTIVKYCKNLKHLKVRNRYHNMNNTALKKLTELENLECLIFFFFIALSEESITAISNNCKKLKRLEIPFCTLVRSIHTDPLSSSSVPDELSKLRCLEHLNLSCSKYLQDSTIIAIANNCKNLKSLEIQGCTGLTETALVALTNFKNLEKLNVSHINIITDSFIVKLKGLKELHCANCKKLTNAGVIQFIKNNPDLELLDVYFIDNITIDLIIAADQATKNRTNGIILHIKLSDRSILQACKSIIKSQWLVVGYLYT